jgi:hypothetical protein
MGEIARTVNRAAEPAAPPGTAVAVTQPSAMAVAKAQYEHTMEAKMSYVRLLAASGLLPKSYIKQPANVLWAMEYAETLGITTMAAIMGVHVIDGRPCASAGLISGLVRKAGHKLRVSGNDETATCTIIRSDDPTYKFEFTWTMKRAQQAGITGKQVWKNYPAAMLQARAITEAARAAAQDVLYGLGYTPEELGADSLDDFPGEIVIAATEPEPDAGVLKAIDVRFTHLGVATPDAKLEAASAIIDRVLGSAADLDADEQDFLLTELEGLEDKAALDKLLADFAAARAEAE